MLFQNVELHNVGGLEEVPGLGPNGFMRIPADVRYQLNDRARFVGMDSVGCEIRFVTDCRNPDITFSFSKPEFTPKAEVRIFRGNFQTMVVEVEPGKVHTIRLDEPVSFGNVDREKIDRCGFASNVWRVCMNRGGSAVLHGINTFGHDIRPPKPEEKPKLNWLAYGSSITNSSLDGYPHFAARLLKVDVQNKGMSGSCQCEHIIADWMAESCEWDFITCEMGINMRDWFTPEEFAERVKYMLNTLVKRHPDKPVVAINLFPNHLTDGWTIKPEALGAVNEIAYNSIVRDVVKEIGTSNLHMIEGSDILTEFTGLSGDLLHPCPFGHAVMGTNLANKLRPILNI